MPSDIDVDRRMLPPLSCPPLQERGNLASQRPWQQFNATRLALQWMARCRCRRRTRGRVRCLEGMVQQILHMIHHDRHRARES